MVIKLFLFIIDLPFTILSMVWKALKLTLRFLRRYGWRAIWHGVYYLLKKPVRLLYALAIVIIMIFGGFAWWQAGHGEQGVLPPLPSIAGEQNGTHNTTQSAVAAAATPPSLSPALSFAPVAELPPMRGEIANANSVFAKPLMERMEPEDLRIYSSYFYYAMRSAHTNQPYRWLVSNNLFGEVTAEAPFQADSGVVCRRFTERLSYGGTHERFTGVACQRDTRSWCKLRPKSAYTCGIDRPSSFKLWLKKFW